MCKKMVLLRYCLSGLLVVYLLFLNNSLLSNAAEDIKIEATYNSVVEIESYQVDNGYIEAGKKNNISFTLHNANKVSAVNSLVIQFSSESGMIYPEYGNDNQIFVGSLKAGESRIVSFPIIVNSDFSADYADITCNLVYETNGNKISNTVTMVIPSGNVNDVIVSSLGVSAHAIKNGKSLLTIVYSNNSNTSINDAELVIDGNVNEATKTIKLEPLVVGKVYTKDCNIVFSETGEQSISVIFKYTESNGELVELDLGKYYVNVVDESASEIIQESENVVLVWIGRGIAALAFIVTIIMISIYIKKR